MNQATRTVKCTRLLLTLSVGTALALSSAPAQAKPPVTVSCGQTITQSVKLANDLSNCPNNGLVIGADDVTVDLNGHTIDGDGEMVKHCSSDLSCDVGVLNDGHTGVTIEGGKVREFFVGVVRLDGANHNRLRDLSSSENNFGLIVLSSGDSRIEKSSFVGNLYGGAIFFESAGNRIERNSVSGTNGYAFVLIRSDNNRVGENVLSGNDHGIDLPESSGNDIRG